MFGSYRSTKLSPREAELLQDPHCVRRGCRGRVRLLEVSKTCHVCFIPLPCLVSKSHVVRCGACDNKITLDLHNMTMERLGRTTAVQSRAPKKGGAVRDYAPVAQAEVVEDAPHVEMVTTVGEKNMSSDESNIPMVEAKGVDIV